MKHIARCMVDMKSERCKSLCKHCFPHEFDEPGRCVFVPNRSHKCNCIPVPLSYYMKEVLEKGEER